MFTEADKVKIIDLVQTRTGIVLNEFRQRDLVQWLERLDPVQRGSLSHLPIDHDLWQEIIAHVTIGETYFFRNQAQFNGLRDHILPALIQQRRQRRDHSLRIWSAGCATGEEPYSLAILLTELLPDIGNWSIVIMGTDINHQYLQKARAAVYHARAFRNETPDAIRERWFDVHEDGYHLHANVKRLVTFHWLNLMDDDFPKLTNGTANLDLILCRNVTIYFNREQTAALIHKFYAALNIGGWLVVGHAEPQPGLYEHFATRHLPNTVVYQKEAPPVLLTTSPAARAITPVEPRAIMVPEAAPVDVEMLIDAAYRAADGERWDVALDALSQVEPHARFDARLYHLRALIFQNQGAFPQAITAIKRAIYCDADNAFGHYILGTLYAQMGKRDKAEREWQRTLQVLQGHGDDEPVLYAHELTVAMLVHLVENALWKGTR